MSYPKFLHLFLFIYFIISSHAFGQEAEKVPVGVAPLEWNSRSANSTYVSMIYDHVTYLLNNNSAVKVVDRDGWESIREEQELLKTEPFILTDNIQHGYALGARKLVTGKVYLTDIRPAGNGFEVSFNVYFAIVNVETGVVEDNIMVSPRGLEDSDKAIEVLRAIRRAQILPRNRFITKIINIMELFDVLEKYQIGGLSEDDSFEKSLVELDKALIPFFDYHFKGITDGYTPAKNKKKTVIVDSYDEEPEPEEMKFPIIEQLSESELRILGGELDGIRPLVRLDLVVESDFEKVSFNGDTIKGVQEEVLGLMGFENYEGEFSRYTWLKSNDLDLANSLATQGEGSRIFLVDPNPKEIEVPDEEQKFEIIDFEDERRLSIAGSTEDGIKRSSRFSVVKEKVISYVDLNGNPGNGIYREELVVLKFAEDQGGQQILELNKGESRSLQEIISRPGEDEKIFVLFKLNNY